MNKLRYYFLVPFICTLLIAVEPAPQNAPPSALHIVQPVYPEELVGFKEKGAVKLDVRIDATGKVTKAKAIESTHPAFGASAEEAVAQWKFSPRIKNGQPVSVRIHLPIEFPVLEEDPAKYYTEDELTTPPLVLHVVRPFTGDIVEAWDTNAKANLEYSIWINKYGDVEKVDIFKSPHVQFKKALQRALLAQKYQPGQVGQKAVNSIMVGEQSFQRLDEYDYENHLSPVKKTSYSREAKYPSKLRKSSESGSVAVELNVNESGKIIDKNVVSSDHKEFTKAALRALKSWVFFSYAPDGQTAIPFSTTAQFQFNSDGTTSSTYEVLNSEMISQLIESKNIARAHYARGREYQKQKKYKEAEEALLKAIEADSTFVGAHYKLAYIYRLQGRLKAAKKLLLLALEVETQPVEAHIRLGSLLGFHSDDIKGAIKHYKKAVELNPDSVSIRNNIGFFYYEQGHYKEAEKHLRKAIELDPEYAYAQESYGQLCTSLKRYEEAEKFLLNAIKLSPDIAHMRDNYGDLLTILGRKKEANAQYKKARSLEENPR